MNPNTLDLLKIIGVALASVIASIITLVLIARGLVKRAKIFGVEFDFTDGKHVQNPVEHRDYLSYTSAFFRFMIITKDMIRECCLHNGFSEMNADEWSRYVDDKLEILAKKSAKYFAESMRRMSVASMEKLLQYKPDLPKMMRTRIRELFDELRAMSVEVHIEADGRQKTLDSYIEDCLSTEITPHVLTQIVMRYGTEIVAIHEMLNRGLMRMQMNRADEVLSLISDENTTMFLEFLSTLMSNKK